jgi:hypothetical protein
MSFALTERQFLDGTKTVTRRLGWRFLKAGDELLAVRKCMGLKKGEKQVVLGKIRVVGAWAERLDTIEQDECMREGFPEMNPVSFVSMFCQHMRCIPSADVMRIEFVRVT